MRQLSWIGLIFVTEVGHSIRQKRPSQQSSEENSFDKDMVELSRKQRFTSSYRTLKKYDKDNTAELPGDNGTSFLDERVVDDSGATDLGKMLKRPIIKK